MHHLQQQIIRKNGEYVGFIDTRAHDLTFVLNGDLAQLIMAKDEEVLDISESHDRHIPSKSVGELRENMRRFGEGNIITSYEDYVEAQKRFQCEPLPNPIVQTRPLYTKTTHITIHADGDVRETGVKFTPQTPGPKYSGASPDYGLPHANISNATNTHNKAALGSKKQ